MNPTPDVMVTSRVIRGLVASQIAAKRAWESDFDNIPLRSLNEAISVGSGPQPRRPSRQGARNLV
jgi:hypothetical protein